MELIKKLGERIRHIRKEKSLSQEKLGELADIHTNYIGAIERGEKNVTIESLIKVTRALEISMEELFRHLEPSNNQDELHSILELLANRSREDRVLALTLLEEIFQWEQKKH